MGKATEAPNKTDKAIRLIESTMKRNGLDLIDMHKAFNVLVGRVMSDTILSLRSKGHSIRYIARFVHMDDKRVSDFIKKCEACKKECKPCKCKKHGK